MGLKAKHAKILGKYLAWPEAVIRSANPLFGRGKADDLATGTIQPGFDLDLNLIGRTILVVIGQLGLDGTCRRQRLAHPLNLVGVCSRALEEAARFASANFRKRISAQSGESRVNGRDAPFQVGFDPCWLGVEPSEEVRSKPLGRRWAGALRNQLQVGKELRKSLWIGSFLVGRRHGQIINHRDHCYATRAEETGMHQFPSIAVAGIESSNHRLIPAAEEGIRKR